MADPRRLLDTEGLVAELLRAEDGSAPPPGARERVLRGILRTLGSEEDDAPPESEVRPAGNRGQAR